MSRVISYSLTIEHEGQIFTIGEDGIVLPSVPPELVAYEEDGWSTEMKHGCVRNKKVDTYLALMAVGNKYQRKQAQIAARWFATILPTREYDEATKTLLIRNYQQDDGGPTFISGWTGGMMMEQFYPNMTKTASGDLLKGFKTPIYGFSPYTLHETFAEKYIKKLEQGIQAMQVADENPGAPNFDDFYK